MANLNNCIFESGRIMRNKRNEKKLSMKELANRIEGLNASQVGVLELGIRKENGVNVLLVMNDLKMVIKICECLDIPLDYMFLKIVDDYHAVNNVELEHNVRATFSEKTKLTKAVLAENSCKYNHGKKIRLARIKHGLSINQAAILIGISPSHLLRTEIGYYGILNSIRLIISICDSLDIPYLEMLHCILNDIQEYNKQ